MKLLPLIALLFAPAAPAADKSILELQRDLALLQDQVKTLDDHVGKIQTLIEQLGAQNSAGAAKSDAKMDALQAELSKTLKTELSAPLAAMSAKLDGVAGDVSTLRDATTENTRHVNALETRMDDMNNVLKAMQTPAALPPATKLFTDAAGDMSGKPDFALTEFQNFLNLYPNDPQAPQAQFDVGQIHYSEGQFDQAAQDFDVVVAKYPDAQILPDAMLMKALALQKAGKRADATAAFKAVIAKFPQSSQASQAKDRLGLANRPAPR